MGKKEKDKKKKKNLGAEMKLPSEKACKTECCEKYKKREDKRCKRCPMFDLIAKVA
ncbi:MAG: hypothetical protein ITG00_01835 [Flavobacterium sp.]|nr:hypothetical protein [Flavobacterium sp.]